MSVDVFNKLAGKHVCLLLRALNRPHILFAQILDLFQYFSGIQR
jgi:hypothetical protein